jgi:hypothetical protein
MLVEEDFAALVREVAGLGEDTAPTCHANIPLVIEQQSRIAELEAENARLRGT